MSLLTSSQAKIDAKIFRRLGSSTTRSPFVSQTTDEWSDATTTYGTDETITTVPYRFFSQTDDFKPFGDLNAGETMFAFKYVQTLNIRDKITFDGKLYELKEIEEFPLANGYLLKVAKAVQTL